MVFVYSIYISICRRMKYYIHIIHRDNQGQIQYVVPHSNRMESEINSFGNVLKKLVKVLPTMNGVLWRFGVSDTKKWL